MKFTDVGKRQNAVFVPVDLIVPDPDQPRKNFDEFEIEQLGVSLLLGQIHPLLVRSIDGGKYMIISGERRWRAAKLKNIPALSCMLFVPTTGLSPEKQHAEITFLALAANRGLPLTDDEITTTIKTLVERDCRSIQEVSEKTGYSDAWIQSALAVSKAPVEVRRAVESKQMSRTAAVAVAKSSEEVQKKIIESTSTGKKVKVKDVQIEKTGHAAMIPARHVQKMINAASKNCVLLITEEVYTKTELDVWEKIVWALKKALKQEDIEQIE